MQKDNDDDKNKDNHNHNVNNRRSKEQGTNYQLERKMMEKPQQKF